MSALQWSDKIYNFTPTVSTLYQLTLKPHKERILKSVVTVFHHSTEE